MGRGEFPNVKYTIEDAERIKHEPRVRQKLIDRRDNLLDKARERAEARKRYAEELDGRQRREIEEADHEFRDRVARDLRDASHGKVSFEEGQRMAIEALERSDQTRGRG